MADQTQLQRCHVTGKWNRSRFIFNSECVLGRIVNKRSNGGKNSWFYPRVEHSIGLGYINYDINKFMFVPLSAPSCYLEVWKFWQGMFSFYTFHRAQPKLYLLPLTNRNRRLNYAIWLVIREQEQLKSASTRGEALFIKLWVSNLFRLEEILRHFYYWLFKQILGTESY